eukprot:gene2416-9794_t
MGSVRDVLAAASRNPTGELAWHRPAAIARFLDERPAHEWAAPVPRQWFVALPSKGVVPHDEVETSLEWLVDATGLQVEDANRLYPAMLRAMVGVGTEPAADFGTLGGIAEVRASALVALVTRALADS